MINPIVTINVNRADRQIHNHDRSLKAYSSQSDLNIYIELELTLKQQSIAIQMDILK